ncbi:hypothetical protein HY792_07900 [Candidatus Desantisbacteria bacterium]|nr:hypothetical protein [Candidatus Desantisbacteria bacterium]
MKKVGQAFLPVYDDACLPIDRQECLSYYRGGSDARIDLVCVCDRNMVLAGQYAIGVCTAGNRGESLRQY